MPGTNYVLKFVLHGLLSLFIVISGNAHCSEINSEVISMKTSSETKKLLTARDLSKWLNLPLPSIYEKTRQNQLPHVRLGKTVRFQHDEIVKFLESGGSRGRD